MSFLLPLEPMGMGTAEVEGMASFFSRLAAQHAVSPYQFANYLRTRTGIMAFGRGDTGRCSGPQSLMVNGLGAGARAAVQWLELGLGRQDVSSMTMLIFENVLPSHGPGVLRQHRAWCPACVTEMRSRGQPEHEKLLWSLRMITRCSTHNLRLEVACPVCESAQRDYGAKAPMSHCRKCQADIVGDPTQWKASRRPLAGENDLHSIVSLAASDPNRRLSGEASRTFFEEYCKRVGRKSLGDDKLRWSLTAAFGREWKRPALTSLVNLALVTDVPLRLILESPYEAVRIALPSETLAASVSTDRRTFRTKGKGKALKAALERAIADEARPVPASLKSICRELDIGTSTAVDWYPHLTAQLIRKRTRAIKEMRAARRARVRAALEDFGLPRYAAGLLRSHDEVVAAIAVRAEASKCLARRELARVTAKRT